ncbi:DUF7507 domain-containing protein [Microbacterium sp.]|uniref:vWA domain-containing protein n=1 Tax=Microbacterium sp. TaxID=51671 RepID=UPI003F9C0CA8
MTKAHRRAHERDVRRAGWRPTALLTVLTLLVGTTMTTAAAIADDPAVAEDQVVAAAQAQNAPDDADAGDQAAKGDAVGQNDESAQNDTDGADGDSAPNGTDGAGDESATDDGGVSKPDGPVDDTQNPSPDTDADTPSDEASTDEEADDAPAPSPEETDSTDGSADETVAPFAVPSPSPSSESAVITVSVGGERTAGSTVSDLAGVTLELFDGGNGGAGSPIGESWSQCVSDSDGDCSFVVPDVQEEIVERECVDWFLWCHEWEETVTQEGGENHDRRFWVAAVDAPNGWYLNDALSTDSGELDYAFRTPGVEAGETYRSGDDFMSWDGDRSSSGIWQVAHTNPQLPQTCQAGVSAALILDLSGSVGDAGALGDLRQASKDMVDALAGTGSSMALYTFADNAPRNNGSSGRNYASMSIDGTGNADTIKDRIDDYTAGGGTNWDEGIWQAAADQADYDLAIVVTDGVATAYRDGGNGMDSRFIETENAVYSANALKAQGTRVLAVGVGDGTSGSAANLRAVAGETPYGSGTAAQDADYFQSSWSELAGLLEDVARGATCQATIEVTKNTRAYGEDTPDNGGAGWTFSAETTNGVLSPDSEQTTDGSGTVTWALQFATPSPAEAADVSLDEVLSAGQLQDGWSLDSATCTVNDGAADDPDQLSVMPGDRVACTFLNVQSLVPGISIVKSAWDTPTADGLDDATEIPAGDAVTSGTTITWTYTVTNTGETTLHDIEVVDDRVGTAACEDIELEPNESTVCTASGPVTALP